MFDGFQSSWLSWFFPHRRPHFGGASSTVKTPMSSKCENRPPSAFGCSWRDGVPAAGSLRNQRAARVDARLRSYARPPVRDKRNKRTGLKSFIRAEISNFPPPKRGRPWQLARPTVVLLWHKRCVGLLNPTVVQASVWGNKLILEVLRLLQNF